MAETRTETKPKATRKKGAGTIARSYLEALGRQDLDAALALWRPGGTDDLVGLETLTAPDGIRRFFSDIYRSMPDFEMEVLSVTAQKDRAAVRWSGKGTFNGTGTFQGLRPNGSRVEIEGCDIFTVQDELIVDNVAYMNGADLARQLGALPPQGSFAEKATTGALNAKVAAGRLIERVRSR